MNLNYLVIISFIGLLFFCILLGQATDASDLHVGSAYTFQSIQEAIQQATDGDTIIIHEGTYNESITVYKSLTLRGFSPNTILEFNGENDLITITANNCQITGLVLRNCTNNDYPAIHVKSNKNLIENNIFENNSGRGLYFYYGSHNQVRNNTFINDGVYIVGQKQDWSTLTIENNTINSLPLLFYKNMSEQQISNKTAGMIILSNCSNITLSHCTIYSPDQGILLGFSSHNNILNNTVSHSYIGIRLQYANHNIIQKNKLTYNHYGLYLTHSFTNKILLNTISSNSQYGCWVCCNAQQNTIAQNTFMNNNNSAYDLFSNNYSLDNIGNFWSDYNGPDTDNDGIGDFPYKIQPLSGPNYDYYPIINLSLIPENEDNHRSSDKQTPNFPLSNLILIFIIVSFLLYSKKFKKR